MPGEPGTRLIGGGSHVSEQPRHDGADTPYDGSVTVPMWTGTVGGTPYLHVAGNERRTNS